MSRLLFAVRLRPGSGSSIRGCDAAEYGCKQPLQRSATDGRETSGTWSAGTTELHLESLHGHGLQRWFPTILSGRDAVSSSRRPPAAVRTLRLRCATQPYRQLRLSAAPEGA